MVENIQIHAMALNNPREIERTLRALARDNAAVVTALTAIAADHDESGSATWADLIPTLEVSE